MPYTLSSWYMLLSNISQKWYRHFPVQCMLCFYLLHSFTHSLTHSLIKLTYSFSFQSNGSSFLFNKQVSVALYCCSLKHYTISIDITDTTVTRSSGRSWGRSHNQHASSYTNIIKRRETWKRSKTTITCVQFIIIIIIQKPPSLIKEVTFAWVSFN